MFLAQPKHDRGDALVFPGAFCRWRKWHTKKTVEILPGKSPAVEGRREEEGKG